MQNLLTRLIDGVLRRGSDLVSDFSSQDRYAKLQTGLVVGWLLVAYFASQVSDVQDQLRDALNRAEKARDESGGLIDIVTDRQILAAYRMLAAKEAVFGELASAAGVAGLIQACEDGQLDAGSRVVCTITGNGLKDPDWAVSAAPAPVTVPADPAAAAAALGLA